MKASNDMAASFEDQEAINRAFDDYLHCQPVSSEPNAREHMLCRGCGGANYRYGTSAWGDAGQRVCIDCGLVADGAVIFEKMYGRVMPTRSSNYKRIHHWHERISQLLLLESPIRGEHMLAIGEKLLDGTHTVINKDTVRAALRSLNLQVYIEKWLQIIHRLTGVMPPAPGAIIMQQLDQLFLDLQQPFRHHKFEKRRNFLNYNYVFCRLFQKMNCAKFCMFFPLIRSKVKLKALDEMWSSMVTSIGWECPPLEHVAPFSVRVERPDALLEQLRQRVAYSDLLETRQDLPKKEIRTLGRPAPRVYRPRPEPLRLAPLEQRPQTLALRLKRKRQREEQ